ncbi:lanC-like protein 2 [Dermatophagoides pteronyssinus]|uniref:lanC-like protein 2 n=1 Tax=Dermatophagoides pteronyssinus TaxID=6956 RepID=UPI003F662FEA
MGERYYPNPYPDYNDGTSLTDNDDESALLIPSLHTVFIDHIRLLLRELETNLMSLSSDNFTIYTGSTGIVLLYLKLYELNAFENERQDILSKVNGLVKQSLENIGRHSKERYSAFLCGQIGVLACKILSNHVNEKDSTKYLQIIRDLAPKILSSDDVPDEILFGRSGYLYSLLMLREKIPNSAQILDNNLIRSVVEKILESGQLTSRKEKNPIAPLVYYWHEKGYVGAAHGYAGILYMLLEARNYLDNDKQELNTLIKPTIDSILRLQFPNTGNFRSSMNNTEDRLVHWCHGSPGIIHLLLLSYEIFNDQSYLDAAKKAADDIWQRGLLKKGCGLCHGTAGNGYAFLRLFQSTNDQKYLYRACKFAEWCFQPNQHRTRIADRPYSLFEGLAGTIYFLADCIQPKQARFPAFQI